MCFNCKYVRSKENKFTVPAVDQMSEGEGGGTVPEDLTGGEVEHSINRDQAIESVNHGGDFGGFSFGLYFEEDEVFDNLSSGVGHLDRRGKQQEWSPVGFEAAE